MAATKECPSCATEVPDSAQRCKVCFHDFTEIPPPKSSPLVLLGAIAIVVVMAIAALGYVLMLPVGPPMIHVDPEHESIVYVTTYRSGREVEELSWAQIGKLEHVITRNGEFQVLAVDLDGKRWTVKESATTPIRGDAEAFAELMNKPLEFVDNTTGFHQAAKQGAAQE